MTTVLIAYSSFCRSPLARACAAKSDDELIELECLRAVQASATLPNGCDLAVYLRLGYVETPGNVQRLTRLGARRLGNLESSTARDV